MNWCLFHDSQVVSLFSFIAFKRDLDVKPESREETQFLFLNSVVSFNLAK